MTSPMEVTALPPQPSSTSSPNSTPSFNTARTSVDDILSNTTLSPSVAASRISSIITPLSETREFLRATFLLYLSIVLSGATMRASFFVVDVAIELVRSHNTEDLLPISLLEYIVAHLSTGELSRHLPGIRARLDLFRKIPHSKHTDLYTIRLFSSSINRNPAGIDAELSGRLRLILAATLSVWHPSGLNLRGHVNTRTVKLLHKSHPGVDVPLYNAFWSTIKAAQNPILLEEASAWHQCKAAMETVLDAFDTVPAREGAALHLSLNSPAILKLQLADENVRRQVLLQYSMVLNHLGWVAANARAPADEKSPPKMKPGEVQRGEFCRSLFQKGGDGSVLRARVIAMLEQTCGFQFKRFAQRMLHRDRRWGYWKKTNFFSKLLSEPHKPSAGYKRRRREPIHVSEDDMNDADYMDRISSMDKEMHMDNLEPRKRMKVEEIIAEVREDKEDPDCTEDMKRANDSRYKWQSIRTLIAEGVQYLHKVHRRGVVYLEGILEDEPLERKVEEGQNGIDHDGAQDTQDLSDKNGSENREGENNITVSGKAGNEAQDSNEKIATENVETADRMDTETPMGREERRDSKGMEIKKELSLEKVNSNGNNTASRGDSANQKRSSVKKEEATKMSEQHKK